MMLYLYNIIPIATVIGCEPAFVSCFSTLDNLANIKVWVISIKLRENTETLICDLIPKMFLLSELKNLWTLCLYWSLLLFPADVLQLKPISTK